MTLLVLGVIALFFAGAPLFAVMVGAAALGALTLPRAFSAEFGGYMQTFFSLGTNEQAQIFSTIPLFIYAGYLMAAAKTADRLVRFANAILGWMPGGLAIVTILASAIFTTFTGASGVTIVALGGLLMPALVKQKYPERFSLGLVAATGSCGLLLPPALPLFVFGAIYGINKDLAAKWEWDTQRFLFAGVVPGAVLLGALALIAIWVAVRNKLPRQRFHLGELASSAALAAPELLLPFGVIGLLASGVSIAQVAALTVVYLVVLEVGLFRDVRPRALWTISTESLALSGTIFLVVFTSAVFTNFLVTAQVPALLVEWTKTYVDSRLVFLLMLNGLLLVVGMMMDVFSAIVIVLPLIAGVADQYGINPYHLGVIFLLNLEIGYLSPPVGLNLFITSFKFRVPVIDVVRAVIPFIGAMIASLLLVTYVPSLTVVPDAKRTGTASALLQLVSEQAQEVRSIREVALLREDGTPVLGEDGRPVVKRFAECAALEDEQSRQSCTGLFVDVTACGERPPAGQTAEECKRDVVAAWISSNLLDDDWDLDDLPEEPAAPEPDDAPAPDGDAPAPDDDAPPAADGAPRSPP
ncbi:MAG: TRAP transporter large permease [Kofleriaceae bacterium]